jgi:hypothetical protein
MNEFEGGLQRGCMAGCIGECAQIVARQMGI